MILWKFKEEFETRENFPCEKFRWVIQTGKWFIEIINQYKLKDLTEWTNSSTLVYGVEFTKHFEIGSEHIYYDGTHCFFSIGWMHIRYHNPNCKKCRSN